MESTRFISIVIPCRNEEKFIASTIKSIIANDYPEDRLEILVVDSSNDGTRKIVEGFLDKYNFIRLLDNPKKIQAAARNIGISQARGEIIMLMDAHVAYPANYITSLAAWLEKSGADNVGGICITRPADGTPMAKAIALAFGHPFGVGNAHFRIGISSPKWVDSVPFGCYRREVFERLGLFDEEMVRTEDDEFNLRLVKNGGRILLVPDVCSYYYARKDLSQVWQMFYYYGYFKPLVWRKYRSIATWRQIIPGAYILILAGVGISGIWSIFACKLLIILMGGYLTANLVVGALATAKNGFQIGFRLIGVFCTMHYSYGLGYLKGILDFLILDKRVTDAANYPISR